jgi:hypothetical protein
LNHGEIVSFIWGVADLIRDTFKRGKYQDVILPLTVLRRLDCVLAPTKAKLLAKLLRLSTGSTAEGLEASKLPILRLVAPPVTERCVIVDFLYKETAKIDALEARVRDGVDRLKEYRTALISATVTGKIDLRGQVVA